MVIVKLTDTKTNSTYQIELSADDYSKAQTDKQFKKQLLDSAIALSKKEEEETKIVSTLQDDQMDQDDYSPDDLHDPLESKEQVGDTLGCVSPDLNSDSDSNSPSENDGDFSTRWSKGAINDLLTIYRKKERLGILAGEKRSSKRGWDMLAREMGGRGHSFSRQQYQRKVASLKKSYQNIKAKGDNRSMWEYYNVMEYIVSKTPKQKEVESSAPSQVSKAVKQNVHNTISSSVVNSFTPVKVERLSDDDMDSECAEDPNDPKRENANIVAVLERHLTLLREGRQERDEERKRAAQARRADRKKDRARLLELLETHLVKRESPHK